jgi:hypothetical protein
VIAVRGNAPSLGSRGGSSAGRPGCPAAGRGALRRCWRSWSLLVPPLDATVHAPPRRRDVLRRRPAASSCPGLRSSCPWTPPPPRAVRHRRGPGPHPAKPPIIGTRALPPGPLRNRTRLPPGTGDGRSPTTRAGDDGVTPGRRPRVFPAGHEATRRDRTTWLPPVHATMERPARRTCRPASRPCAAPVPDHDTTGEPRRRADATHGEHATGGQERAQRSPHGPGTALTCARGGRSTQRRHRVRVHQRERRHRSTRPHTGHASPEHEGERCFTWNLERAPPVPCRQ